MQEISKWKGVRGSKREEKGEKGEKKGVRGRKREKKGTTGGLSEKVKGRMKKYEREDRTDDG